MDGLEESGESAASGDASGDASGALDVSTAKRPAVKRRGRVAHSKRGHRLWMQGALPLIGLKVCQSLAIRLAATLATSSTPISVSAPCIQRR